jgi:hypothetical protein
MTSLLQQEKIERKSLKVLWNPSRLLHHFKLQVQSCKVAAPLSSCKCKVAKLQHSISHNFPKLPQMTTKCPYCTKTFVDPKGISRHIKTEKSKELNNPEDQRPHTQAVIRPRGKQRAYPDPIIPIITINDGVDFAMLLATAGSIVTYFIANNGFLFSMAALKTS